MDDKKLLVLIDSVDYAKTALQHAKQTALKNNKHIDVVAFSFEETGNILFSLSPEKVLAIQDKQLSQLKAELEPILAKELGSALNIKINNQFSEKVILKTVIDKYYNL